MSVYEFALLYWVAIAVAGLAAAFGAVLARETRRAVECLRQERRPAPSRSSQPTWPSSPTPSTPSYPGF